MSTANPSSRPASAPGESQDTAARLSPVVRQQISDLRTTRHNWRSVLELGSTYGLLLLGLWLVKTAPHWAAYPAGFLIVGLMQYRLVMSSHEAVHKTLLSPVWLNEVFGSVNAALVGVSFFNYRKTHLEHHKSPQHIRDDTDAYIYGPLLKCRPGLRRLALLLFGVWVDIWVKMSRKLRGIRPEQQQGTVASATDSQLWLIITLQGVMLGLFTVFLHWWQYFVFWFAPIFVVALTMDRIRIFVEHGYCFLFLDPTPSVDEAWQATVDIDTNVIEGYLLAPFGFIYHQAHHAQLTVPYYNLPRLSQLMLAHDPRYNRVVKGSYVGILARMIWAAK
jgi:fatty acid desaturase